jgi:hypothetical protein
MWVVLMPGIATAVVLLGVVVCVERWRRQRDAVLPSVALSLLVKSLVSRL